MDFGQEENEEILKTGDRCFFSKAKCDPDPKSKGGPGPVSGLGPVVSPGSIHGSWSVSGANVPTDILASEMQRDPAFALAVSSLERCQQYGTVLAGS